MNKSRFRVNTLVLVMLVALLATSVVGAAPKDGAIVSLSVAQSEFDSAQIATSTSRRTHRRNLNSIPQHKDPDA